MFKLVHLLSFILFKKLLLNYEYFVSYVLFEKFFWFIYIFFYLSYGWTLFLKIKKLLSYIISNMCSHAWCFFFLLFYSINLICVSISIIICLNKEIILINKFSKHNRVNVSSFEIKYLDLHPSLDFSSFIFRHH